MPLLRVIVAIEDDPLALLDDAREQILNRPIEILPTPGGVLKLRGNRIQRLGHDRVQHRVRPGDILRAAHRAEFKLISRKRKRRGAIAISRILGQLRQSRHARLKQSSLLGALGAALFDLLDDVVELLAQKD